ncbi:hypothetical protein LIER_36211 [Lithospermum erythrorhizon]|uniref:Uncharacterized protein n=1 Tax=Lithospermum erythrorhizon TaxID=34254 RepID=A0AAV3P6K3_LITER
METSGRLYLHRSKDPGPQHVVLQQISSQGVNRAINGVIRYLDPRGKNGQESAERIEAWTCSASPDTMCIGSTTQNRWASLSSKKRGEPRASRLHPLREPQGPSIDVLESAPLNLRRRGGSRGVLGTQHLLHQGFPRYDGLLINFAGNEGLVLLEKEQLTCTKPGNISINEGWEKTREK